MKTRRIKCRSVSVFGSCRHSLQRHSFLEPVLPLHSTPLSPTFPNLTSGAHSFAMLRLPRQKISKALCSSLRNPSHRQHVRSLQVPVSAPPTYVSIAQRLSSDPSPLTAYDKRIAEEAKASGQFVDIHDAEVMSATDYDVLIPDITDQLLRNEIAELAGIQYLQKATEADKGKVNVGCGFFYGNKFRPIFPCVVTSREQSRWVFFLVDSGAPLTYLSAQVCSTYL